jgi:hypothetical protein
MTVWIRRLTRLDHRPKAQVALRVDMGGSPVPQAEQWVLVEIPNISVEAPSTSLTLERWLLVAGDELSG